MSNINVAYHYAPAYEFIEPTMYKKAQMDDIIKRSEFKILVMIHLEMEELRNEMPVPNKNNS